MHTLGAESEKNGLDGVEVAVAAGHMRDRLKAEAALHTSRKHRCIHACARDGVVRNRDGMNTRCLKFACPRHEFIRIAGLGWIEFDGDGEIPRL